MLKDVGSNAGLPEFESLIFPFPELCVFGQVTSLFEPQFPYCDVGIMLASLGCGEN